MKKRTNEDWSKHELIIDKNDKFIRYTLKIPNTRTQMIVFTNIDGNLLVTGDYSDWVFCREFHPTPDGMVSDYYWCEKLTIANHNIQYKHFDTDITRERIIEEAVPELIEAYELDEDIEPKLIELIKKCDYYTEVSEFLEENNIDHDESLIEEIEYWCKCYASAEDEYEYVEVARDYPERADSDSMIFGKIINYQLQAIFDAFDEICRRLKEKNK